MGWEGDDDTQENQCSAWKGWTGKKKKKIYKWDENRDSEQVLLYSLQPRSRKGKHVTYLVIWIATVFIVPE